MTTWRALAWAGAAIATALGGASVPGCSSSSSSPAAAAGSPDATDFDALPPLGVGQANCTAADCPAPATCGGALIGPNSPITFCTLVCSKGSDCPPGDVCAPLGIGQCLKGCTMDSDCSGGFTCRAQGGYCYSPYSGADAVPDASADDAPAANGEAGPVEAGGGSEAGPTDAGSSDASEASASAEAGADGPSDAGGEAAADAPAG